MNKRYWLVVQSVMALILMAVLMTGCEKKGVTSTSGLLTEITMALAVDKDSRPLQLTTVFTPDADAFFCSFKVIDAPPETEIKGEWTYVSGEVEEQIGQNYVMDELTIPVEEGTRYAFVYYLRPPVPDYRWPKGDYKVVLYVNNEEDASIPFTVKEKEAGLSDGTVSELTMAMSVDSEGRPLQPTSVFPIDAEGFYCSFKLSNFIPGTKIRVEWVYVGGEAEEEIGENAVFEAQTATIERKGAGYTSTVLQRPSVPDYTWPKGDYKVILYVDDEEEASVLFKVE